MAEDSHHHYEAPKGPSKGSSAEASDDLLQELADQASKGIQALLEAYADQWEQSLQAYLDDLANQWQASMQGHLEQLVNQWQSHLGASIQGRPSSAQGTAGPDAPQSSPSEGTPNPIAHHLKPLNEHIALIARQAIADLHDQVRQAGNSDGGEEET